MNTLLLVLQFSLVQDSVQLRTVADSFDVPFAIVEAIAWMETRTGVRWNALGPGVIDSTWSNDGTLVIHRKCREVGRFQLRPCIDWVSRLNDRDCSSKLIVRYENNIHCGIKNLRLLYDTRCNRSWLCVIKRQNGAGPLAEKYVKETLMYIGWRAVYGID